MGSKTPEEKAAKKAKKEAKAKAAAAAEAAAAEAPASPKPKKEKKEKKRKAEAATPPPAAPAATTEADEKAAKKARKAEKKAKKAAAAAAAAPAEPAKEEAPAKAAAEAPAADGDVKSIFCTNLAWSIDEDTLKAHFSSAGPVSNIKWIEDRDTGKFKGMCVVDFASGAAASKAVAEGNEKEVAGRTLYCRLDKPKPPRAGGAGAREPRQPKPKPEGCCKLYCGNLSYDIDDAALRSFFEPQVLSAIRWVTDRNSGEFKGCGFAEFGTTEDADAGFGKQGEALLGRPIRLDWAEDKKREW